MAHGSVAASGGVAHDVASSDSPSGSQQQTSSWPLRRHRQLQAITARLDDQDKKYAALKTQAEALLEAFDGHLFGDLQDIFRKEVSSALAMSTCQALTPAMSFPATSSQRT